MKQLAMRAVKRIMPALLKCFGIPLHDVQTGEFLGRVLIFRWKGKLRIVGLKEAVVPFFMPRSDIKYRFQDLGFSKHESPDFPSIRDEGK